MRNSRLVSIGLLFFLAAACVPALQAQSPASAPATVSAAVVAPSLVTAERIDKLEQQVANAQSSADNAWMLTSAALVLLMTGPGLALFYGGLVRRKNVLSVM